MSERFQTNENYPDHVWDTIDRRWKPKSNGSGKLQGPCTPFNDDQGPERPAVVNLQRASELKATPISWVWPGWLARGKAHIIGGQPGAGKTTLAMKIAAAVSTGGRWPDGIAATKGNVIIWSGEDDPADTLVPRLAASGADLEHVFFVQDVLEGKERRPFDPAKDIGPLKQAIEAAGGASCLLSILLCLRWQAIPTRMVRHAAPCNRLLTSPAMLRPRSWALPISQRGQVAGNPSSALQGQSPSGRLPAW